MSNPPDDPLSGRSQNSNPGKGRGSGSGLLPLLARRSSLERGDVRRLDCRVELHRITALLARAVTGTLAAAERYVKINARGRQIHHHHSGLAVAPEVRRMLE